MARIKPCWFGRSFSPEDTNIFISKRALNGNSPRAVEIIDQLSFGKPVHANGTKCAFHRFCHRRREGRRGVGAPAPLTSSIIQSAMKPAIEVGGCCILPKSGFTEFRGVVPESRRVGLDRPGNVKVLLRDGLILAHGCFLSGCCAGGGGCGDCGFCFHRQQFLLRLAASWPDPLHGLM